MTRLTVIALCCIAGIFLTDNDVYKAAFFVSQIILHCADYTVEAIRELKDE